MQSGKRTHKREVATWLRNIQAKYISCDEENRGQSYQTFFLRKRIIFLFVAVKLGHFIVNASFFICYKHSRLTAKIGKHRKTKIGRINSCQSATIFQFFRRLLVLKKVFLPHLIQNVLDRVFYRTLNCQI